MEARELTAAQCRVAERMAAAEREIHAQRRQAAAVSARDLLDEMQRLAYEWIRDRDRARSVPASDPLAVWARAVAPSDPPPPPPKATFGAAVSEILDRRGTRLDRRLNAVADYYLLKAFRFIEGGLTRHVLASSDADVDRWLRLKRGKVVTLLSERLPLQDFDAAAGGTAGGSFGSDGAGPRRERPRSPFIMHLMRSSSASPPPPAGDIGARRAILSWWSPAAAAAAPLGLEPEIVCVRRAATSRLCRRACDRPPAEAPVVPRRE